MPKRYLKDRYIQQAGELTAYSQRLGAWQKVLLEEEPTEEVLQRVADLLARLGFEPDECDYPHGGWPRIADIDPRVLLDGLGEVVIVDGEENTSRRESSWKFKADLLRAAILVWAGAIDLDREQIAGVAPRASVGSVLMLLLYCDLGAFMQRPGYSYSKDEVRQRWEEDDFMDAEELRAMIRRM